MSLVRPPSTCLALLAAVLLAASGVRGDLPDPLPDPDGAAADMTKPVRVYILMGQSNMLGFGAVEPEGTPGTLATLVKAGRYPFLVDDAGAWTVRHDVRDVFVMHNRGRMDVKRNAWLTPPAKGRFGPELGFGAVMGTVHEEPVLLLKACIGNRSLGWDLLPPGSARYVADGKVYAGYKDRPDSWPADPAKGTATEPPPWLDKQGKPIDWYAGKQYDDDVANAKRVLADLATYYPEATHGHEVAGFVWWQGHKDQNPVHAAHYEDNLVRLIKALRQEFNAPNAKVVLATGCGNPGREGPGLTIAEAQLAVDGDSGRHPEFKGTVKAVDVRPLWPDPEASPSKQGYHYFWNAGLYMDVGLALGKAMAELEGLP